MHQKVAFFGRQPHYLDLREVANFLCHNDKAAAHRDGTVKIDDEVRPRHSHDAPSVGDSDQNQEKEGKLGELCLRESTPDKVRSVTENYCRADMTAVVEILYVEPRHKNRVKPREVVIESDRLLKGQPMVLNEGLRG